MFCFENQKKIVFTDEKLIGMRTFAMFSRSPVGHHRVPPPGTWNSYDGAPGGPRYTPQPGPASAEGYTEDVIRREVHKKRSSKSR